MKKNLREFIFQLLFFSKLSSLARLIRQKHSVTIVVFHNPTPKKMEEFILFYSEKYSFISLQDYLLAKKTGSLNKLPLYPLIMTLDDGHINNYLLLEGIKNYKIPVTIFLCSGIVGTSRGFWFNSLSNEACQKLKDVPQNERIEILSQNGFNQNDENQEVEALTEAHINEMKVFVDFQGHSRFHPILPNCDKATATDEIVASKNELKQRFGLSINAFAYPNGDYSDQDIELCREAGYELALSLDDGLNDIETDHFKIKRICIPDNASVSELSVKSSGLWAMLKKR